MPGPASDNVTVTNGGQGPHPLLPDQIQHKIDATFPTTGQRKFCVQMQVGRYVVSGQSYYIIGPNTKCQNFFF